MPKARILIVDDEADICALLAESLSDPQREVQWTTNPLQALEQVKSDPPELVLLDIKMPEISGLDLLPQLKKASPESAVLIMSAFGNIPIAVEAMKRGADDYLEKPFRHIDEVRLTATRLLNAAHTRSENRSLRRQLEEKFQLGGLISASPKMQQVFDLARKVAPLTTTILITGETGTGKELIARTLHQNSHRSTGPFVCVNCGGLPEGLLESLLFGHERGSFTGAVRQARGFFEEAEGGMLFLDEVGEMPLTLQVKLLRVLQERVIQRLGGSREVPIDVRLTAATNKDLRAAVANGAFRQDLFYRLNVITIHLPPLRERREDIYLLARHFVDKYATAFKRGPRELSREVVSYLHDREWPGNVRQLENTIERAVALSECEIINAEAFTDSLQTAADDAFSRMLQQPMRQACRLFESHYLKEILRRRGGNVTQAARSAGLPRQNFHRKMKQLGIRSRVANDK
jgi:DNA-binding NtrC family response regulator